MNWKLKAHGLAVLSRIPAGRRVYLNAQRVFGTNRLNVGQAVERSLDLIHLARDAGAEPPGRVWLEIGTGWRPFLPFILHLAGAARVITLDINPWLNAGYAFETHHALTGQLEALARELAVDPALVRSRYARITPQPDDLAGLLRAYRVDYRCPADAADTGLPAESVDVVCSSNVLEHIPPDVLSRIHAESFRILKPAGLSVHRLNPQDHYSHVDQSITGSNFLRYSQSAWRWYGGSGLAYHNRLRCPQHADLLAHAGFVHRVSRMRGDPRAVQAIRSGVLPVHEDFKRFSLEDLTADYMWLAGERYLHPSAPRPLSDLPEAMS